MDINRQMLEQIQDAGGVLGVAERTSTLDRLVREGLATRRAVRAGGAPWHDYRLTSAGCARLAQK